MDNVEALRANAGFSWKVLGSTYALMEYERISLHDYYTEPDAGIRLFRYGRPKLRELFGEEVLLPAISTPDTGYGHVTALGAPFIFPPGEGEIGVSPLFSSLEEGVMQLRKRGAMDFRRCGVAPMMLEYRRKLQEAFPEEFVGYGASGEGPVTTAFLLSGQSVLMEFYDHPGLMGEYLALLTASENEYHHFVCSVLGCDPINPEYAYLADDAAAFVPPGLFDEFVLPHWERQYRARTGSGLRELHCEGLRPAQLGWLEKAGVGSFDPSVSPALTPAVIRDACSVPFDWRLVSFHLWDATVQQVFDFVVHLAADGASGTYLAIAQNMSEGENLNKVRAYISSCKEVCAALARGCPREALRSLAVQRDGQAFWRSWPGSKGSACQ